MLSRSARKALGEETVAILKQKSYTTKSGKVVSLEAPLHLSLGSTRIIAADETIPLPQRDSASRDDNPTIFEVSRESTLEACSRLYKLYSTSGQPQPQVMCLNFASAHNPGGGFLTGSQAQEESLARNSTLYASQTACPGMYQANGKMKRGDCAAPHTLYTDAMTFSPHVMVFREEHEGSLLEEPYPITIVSAPAPNAGATVTNFGKKKGVPAETLWKMIDSTMRRRVERVLALCAEEKIECLVLGAYGCGVFQNKTETVIEAYQSLLHGDGPFAGVFRHVVYAVYAPKKGDRTFLAFQRAFGEQPAVE